MNPATVQLIIELASRAAKVALEVKQQSGVSDEVLLAQAAKNSEETKANVKAFLEAHK